MEDERSADRGRGKRPPPGRAPAGRLCPALLLLWLFAPAIASPAEADPAPAPAPAPDREAVIAEIESLSKEGREKAGLEAMRNGIRAFIEATLTRGQKRAWEKTLAESKPEDDPIRESVRLVKALPAIGRITRERLATLWAGIRNEVRKVKGLPLEPVPEKPPPKPPKPKVVVVPAPPSDDPRAQAESKKQAASRILILLAAGDPTDEARAKDAAKAMALLEEAKRILAGLGGEKTAKEAEELDTLQAWARALAAKGSRPGTAPAPAEAPEEPVAEPPGEAPGEAPEEPPVPDDPAEREKAAQEALASAKVFEGLHPDDPMQAAARYMDVGEKFPGTKAGIESQSKALDCIRRIKEGGGDAKKPDADPGEAEPADPGLAFDRIEGEGVVSVQLNPRLKTNLHYLWARIRFMKGDRVVRPENLTLRITQERRGVLLGAGGGDVAKSAWEETFHDLFWNSLSHQPAADAPLLAKIKMPRKPVHAHQGFLYVFVSCPPKPREGETKEWQLKVEALDRGTKRRILSSAPLPVRLSADPVPKDGEKDPALADTSDPVKKDVAYRLYNLAIDYLQKHRFEEGESILRRAAAIYIRLGGLGDPDSLQCLTTFATMKSNRRMFPEAEHDFRRCIEIIEGLLGPDPPVLAKCLENYAGLLRNVDRKDEAKAMDERAMNIRVKEAVAPSGEKPSPPADKPPARNPNGIGVKCPFCATEFEVSVFHGNTAISPHGQQVYCPQCRRAFTTP